MRQPHCGQIFLLLGTVCIFLARSCAGKNEQLHLCRINYIKGNVCKEQLGKE